MAFSHKRGRPKKEISKSERDKGTPELQQKRKMSLTTEAVDLLLQQGIITPNQHWCALHYRWLYTLRYGSPTLQSMDPAYVRGIQHKKEYEEWQQEREAEWQQAQEILLRQGSRRAITNVAIYNMLLHADFTKIKEGLETLSGLWCKNTPSTPSMNHL